ncbi:hypothetical protein [Thiorhodococcus minor]|uniref:Uncharacterized protein n=1 Tax=Thiorhodococcus minor TaxID=57489 RepID=A0A6M0K565_9GAMM|nr:hypothetical protein [Thiorhodococcus minor]NEV64063.1 hypothetical protein [Thiorhodococcus minor]
MKDGGAALSRWEDLDVDAQIDLRIAFGYYLDGLPPTCSLEAKVERFHRWLLARGVAYQDPNLESSAGVARSRGG